MNTYITSENIEEIKRRLDFLANNYDVKYKDVKIGVDSIEILFAEEKDYIIYPVEDFLLYTNNIQSLKGVNESTVRTDSIRQSVINLKHARLFIDVFSDIHYTVLLVESPLLIGLLNNVEKCTEDERLCSPCSSISAIEIRYDSTEYVLPEEQESDIINRVLYYLIDKYNFINFSLDNRSVRKVKYTIKLDLTKDSTQTHPIQIASLPHCSPILDLYSEALLIRNNDIKFLYFYKVIEYISPIVAKIKAHEEVCRKFSSGIPATGNVDSLDSGLSMRAHDKHIKDRDLVKIVMEQCDIVKLYEFLPEWVQERCLKETKASKQQSAIGIVAEKERTIKNKVAVILYATRNSIVHAKANFKPTENECPEKDLYQLNIFMRKLCKDLISWKDKHPEITLK